MGCAAIAEFPLAMAAAWTSSRWMGRAHLHRGNQKLGADFRSDGEMAGISRFCDRFYFAVAPEFPQDLLPVEVGLIVADDWHGTVLRESPAFTMNGSRRRAQTLRIAMTAAQRLRRFTDPRP